MSELKSKCCGSGVVKTTEVDRGRSGFYNTICVVSYKCKKCGKPCEIGGNDPLITPTDSHECDFCGGPVDGKLVLRDTRIEKEDGSDIVLCSDCMNNYAAGNYDKIKLKGVSEGSAAPSPAGPESDERKGK